MKKIAEFFALAATKIIFELSRTHYITAMFGGVVLKISIIKSKN